MVTNDWGGTEVPTAPDVVVTAPDTRGSGSQAGAETEPAGGVLARLIRGPHKLRRVWHYALTSVVATAVSEATLVVVYGSGALGASTAAVGASLAGTVPSYLLSRYWIWPEADRRHVGRQASPFWLIALVSLVLSSAITGMAADLAPAGRTAHIVVVALAYIGTYGALWLAKFALYQGILFRPAHDRTETANAVTPAPSLTETPTPDADAVGCPVPHVSIRQPRRRLALRKMHTTRRVTPLGLALAVTLVVVTLTSCTSTTTNGTLPSLGDPIRYPASNSPTVAGPIHSPGGPFLYDQNGRVVFFHGVNAVYKLAPYELYPAPGKLWDFSPADASLIARLGFNMVRLGMTWKGLEPGTAPANDPAICAKGSPGDPGQFNQAVLDRYLSNLKETVTLLGRFHIYSLLDMHQDVYNEMFDGEGAPNWAVCTDGLANTDPPGRWSKNYATAAAGAAYRHFWTNDVVGNLQGEYDRVWAAVASYFRGNPWVLGYDPFNEPFSTSLVTSGDEQFDAQLECFYTGTALVGAPAHGAPAITCPPNDPALGVIAQIRAADPDHLIFYEPDIYGSRGYTNFVGPMNFSNLVFNVHVYCGYRSGKTGNPTDIAACAAQETRSLKKRSEDRTDLGSSFQPQGPAWFVSEFGATSNATLLERLTDDADQALVGWAYWSWKYYHDPTGSSAEALVTSEGQLRSTARVLARTYPEAIAGRPTSLSFDPRTGAFRLVYQPDPAIHAPTVIFVPTQIHYANGYCARATGGTITSRPESEFLQVANGATGRAVSITVTSGTCPS